MLLLKLRDVLVMVLNNYFIRVFKSLNTMKLLLAIFIFNFLKAFRGCIVQVYNFKLNILIFDIFFLEFFPFFCLLTSIVNFIGKV